jgi:tripartite-type tricarboxylate transporter receptor subunit TctC
MMNRRIFLASAVATGCTICTPANAQAFPSHPIKIVVAQAPGGPGEVVMRLVAERLALLLAQPVIIENRPGGAGGTISAKFVAGSQPDGYTLYWAYPGPLVTAPLIYRTADYDPRKAFAPIAAAFTSPLVLVAHPSVPASSLEELTVYLKANPGKATFGSAGLGTQPHLLGELLKVVAGVDIVHAPYRGGGLAVQDLVAGQTQIQFDTLTLLSGHIASGQLKAIAVTDTKRIAALPKIPTTVEAGLPQLQGAFWSGIVAPAGTPEAVIIKLNAAINDVMQSSDVRSLLTKLNAEPRLGSPQDFSAFMEFERQKWAAIIQAAKIEDK